MSLAVELAGSGAPQLARLERGLNQLAFALREPRPLLDALGAELVSQMQRRIADEKETPGGQAWEPWSEDYAETRHGGQSLLQGEGSLLDSLQHAVTGTRRAEAGSNLIYAALQHFGGEPGMPVGPAAVPAREWLGASREGEAALLAIVAEFAAEAARGSLP